MRQFTLPAHRSHNTMAIILYQTIVLGIFLSVLKASTAKICTKQVVVVYKINRPNPITGRLIQITQSKLSIIDVCCEGYHNVGDPQVMPPKCVPNTSVTTEVALQDEPSCDPPCGQGTCVDINRCACDPGYKHSVEGSCVRDENVQKIPFDPSEPVCNPTCGHGTCFDTNRCACDPGYKHSAKGSCVLDESVQTIAVDPSEPVCNPTCGNGTCFDTNRCACDPGYKHSAKGSCVLDESVQTISVDSSEPVCKPPCGQGKCYDTNSCACFQGYTHSANGICVAIQNTPTTTARTSRCGSCFQGKCLLETFCVCPDGYRLIEGNCQPICSMACLNGRCIAHNKCECIDGYTFDSESLQCKPMCNGKIYGCIGGSCVGHNQCHCNNGTVLDKDELFRCISAESLKQEQTSNWMWHLLWIPAAGIMLVSFYIIIKRFARAAVNRINGENKLYFFTDDNPTGNQLDSDKSGYVMGELSMKEGNEEVKQRNANVVIINT